MRQRGRLVYVEAESGLLGERAHCEVFELEDIAHAPYPPHLPPPHRPLLGQNQRTTGEVFFAGITE